MATMIPAKHVYSPGPFGSTALITLLQTQSRTGKVPVNQHKMTADTAHFLLMTGGHSLGLLGKIDLIETVEIPNLQEISNAINLAANTPESKQSNQNTVKKLNSEIAQYTVDCITLKEKIIKAQETLIKASQKVNEKINSFPDQETLDKYLSSSYFSTDKEFQEFELAKKRITEDLRKELHKLEPDKKRTESGDKEQITLDSEVGNLIVKIRSSQSHFISIYGSSDLYNPEIKSQITPQELKDKVRKSTEASKPPSLHRVVSEEKDKKPQTAITGPNAASATESKPE